MLRSHLFPKKRKIFLLELLTTHIFFTLDVFCLTFILIDEKCFAYIFFFRTARAAAQKKKKFFCLHRSPHEKKKRLIYLN